MKSPGSTPRRRKASPGARLRPFRGLIALVVLALAGGAAFLALWPGFVPKHLVVSGNEIVSRGEIVAAAGVSDKINMWLQNPGAIAARIERIPYIATAHVHRIPPTTMSLAVSERKPFAVVHSGSAVVLVDHDLRVLQPAQDDPPALPQFVIKSGAALEAGSFLTDPASLAMRDDYDAMIAAHVVPTELSFDRFGGLVADVRGGVRILLGDDNDLAKKLALVDPILAQVVRKERRVAAVDLRAPNTPVVVYK